MSNTTTRELAYRENDRVEVALARPVGERWVLVRMARMPTQPPLVIREQRY